MFLQAENCGPLWRLVSAQTLKHAHPIVKVWVSTCVVASRHGIIFPSLQITPSRSAIDIHKLRKELRMPYSNAFLNRKWHGRASMRQDVACDHAVAYPASAKIVMRGDGGRKKSKPRACQYRIWSGRLSGEHFIPQLQHCGDAIVK